MDREKQIEEMIKTLHEGMKPIKETYGTDEIASILYNAGYRLATDVAREIISIIEQRISTTTEHKEGLQSTIWRAHYEGCAQAYVDIKEIIEQKYTEVEG